VVLSTTGCAATYSDGDRAGIVTKWSHKGFIHKSWEGQLLKLLAVEEAPPQSIHQLIALHTWRLPFERAWRGAEPSVTFSSQAAVMTERS
jgi:hypothetical protein